MTVLEIRQRAAQESEEARKTKDKADSESRDMTVEEALSFDKYLAESRRYEKNAERQEALEKNEAILASSKQATATETANGAKLEGPRTEHFRYSQLRAFKGPMAEANAYKSGRWLLSMDQMAKFAPELSARSRQWCRDHGVEMRVQTEGVNTSGGYVVPDEMERSIIDLRETYGTARQQARVLPMSSDHMIIPRRTGGITAYFVGETTEITASDKSWNQVELTAKKLGALTRMSTDLSEDAIINIADDLAQEMAYAFAAKEDACAIDGDGTATYGGMTGIRTKMNDGVHVGSYVDAAAAGDNWSEIDGSDLTNVMGALPAYARRGAKWHCSPVARVAVFDRLIAAAGGATMREIESGANPRYMGYPIIEWAAMPTDYSAAALNDKIMLFFGDYTLSTTLGSRRGITIKVSDQRYLEYDQIGIQATERFCIVNHDVGGLAAATRGPVVGLRGTT